MKAPRNQPRVIVKSLQDVGMLMPTSGTDPNQTAPEAPLSAIAVLDNDSITAVSQDSQGNINVKVSTSEALHPALLKDSTMTITTGPGRVHQPSHLTATTNVTPFPTQPSTQESNTIMQTANNQISASNNQALDTRDQAQGVVRADISNDLRPDAPASNAPAAGEAAAFVKRPRRLFRAEPEGNFEESYQAGLDTHQQLGTLRARVAHHSAALAAHDGEIDDLQHNLADLAKTVEENAKIAATARPYAREEKNIGYYAEQAGTMVAIGGGMMLGIGAVAVASDWLFGTNLATLPSGNNNA